jgi:alkylhydroperoxidase/carboxymuconolactone decarboxylase family protein YurZ
MNGNPLEVIKKLDNEFFNNIDKTRATAFKDGALSAKNKLLIAIALDASLGAVNGVKSLTTQAMKNGATKEEIIETLHVVNYITGVGGVYTAAAALNDIL